MATLRRLIGEALAVCGAVSLGDSPSADELAAGVNAFGRVTEEIHEARGPLLDVDVTADYIASENQRVRVQAGDTVDVTLPNAIPIFFQPDPYDYGFAAPSMSPPQGSIGEADGVSYRQPRDGTRIEIVGTTQGLWFYRADINAWMPAYGLTIDAEAPFNKRLDTALVTLLAEKLVEFLPAAEMTPLLASRIARGRTAMLLRTGTAHDAVRAEYF